ncbi:hypothetical protein K1T71_003725 [Dendrolimus kikuchii]|uniref:Uncharacterized protein n=1 Tax=Dendrolimus kikuchii TaxID=765133 RepID=A0ACC1D904_9NEOP|nr:hypothetical protein K1T71_003725 [Dendrolimus kikuchii]
MAMNLKFNVPKPKVPKFLKSIRYTLAAVNGLFLITGIVLLIVGIVLLIQYTKYEELLTQRFFNISGFVIATAVIVLLNSGLGFYGAISEQFYFIAGYVLLLLIVLIFEIIIVVLCYGLRNDAASEIRSTMLQSLQLYTTRLDIAKIWDDLQMGFECCGVGSNFDYISNQIPVSCCHIDYGTISPFECRPQNTYSDGCATVLGEWLSYNAYVVALTALIITCLQIIITSMSGWLAWRSKFEEVELES